MLTLDEIKIELAKPFYKLTAVANGAGIPISTLHGMLKSNNANYKNVLAVSNYLENNALLGQRRIAKELLNDPRYSEAAGIVIKSIDERIKNDKTD